LGTITSGTGFGAIGFRVGFGAIGFRVGFGAIGFRAGFGAIGFGTVLCAIACGTAQGALAKIGLPTSNTVVNDTRNSRERYLSDCLWCRPRGDRHQPLEMKRNFIKVFPPGNPVPQVESGRKAGQGVTPSTNSVVQIAVELDTSPTGKTPKVIGVDLRHLQSCPDWRSSGFCSTCLHLSNL
jgi:hypothetical protein